MPPDHKKPSFHLRRLDKPTNKKDVELDTVENNNGVLRLVMWSGAFVFACLLIASTLKKSKNIISPKSSREGDSDLDVGGFRESTTRDADHKARKMEGLQLLLFSSTDIIIHPCHTSSKMFRNSIEDSQDENLHLTTESILEKKEEENIVVIIYEEEYINSEESIEKATQKYDGSSKVAQSFPSTAFDEDDKNRPSSTSSSSSSSSSLSSSSSSSSSSSKESSSSGVLSQEIDGDHKKIDIIIYIDDENHEHEHAHI